MKTEEILAILNNEELPEGEKTTEILKLHGVSTEKLKTSVDRLKNEKSTLAADKQLLDDKLSEMTEQGLTLENLEALKSEKETLEQTVADMSVTHEAEKNNLVMDMLLNDGIKGYGVRSNPKAVSMVKEMLKELGDDAIKIENGELVGFKETMDELFKEDTGNSFLLDEQKEDPKPSFSSFSDRTEVPGGEPGGADAFDSAW